MTLPTVVSLFRKGPSCISLLRYSRCLELNATSPATMCEVLPTKLAEDGEDLKLPRILCLHGGGSNAQVFKSQCRVLSKQLHGLFRLCFVAAPWTSEAGPDVTSVYQAY